MDKAVFRRRLRSARRRLLALAAAGATLWLAAVTAGAQTFSAAASAARAALPLSVLRWELGDLRREEDPLSAAAMLAISQSPLLLSAKEEVADLWSREEGDQQPAPAAEPEPPAVTRPVTETPVETPLPATDNGVPARTLVPSGPSGYTVAGKVYISNATGYGLSLQELTESPAAVLGTDSGEPQILIVHTHGSECYTPPESTDIAYTGDHRTTDTRYNVVRVGDEMAQAFADAGIPVLHDRSMYDYPSYSGAYDRSLEAVERYLEEYPSIRFVLDVHRDAVQDGEGNQYKVVSVVEEGTAAQLTLVVGSDGTGLTHPNWRENLKLAVRLQEDVSERYPSLMRPILLRNSRYNQHVTPGSLLIEVGAAGNSPDEAVLAGRLFARSMAETLKGGA